MQTFQELKSRGFCFQGTDESELEKLLNGAPGVRFYVGFDPTGSSLHVGHLLPVMAMRLLQRHGHIPIVLVGGATARIGDPSGKSTARPMMTVEEINANAESLKQQLSRFIALIRHGAELVELEYASVAAGPLLCKENRRTQFLPDQQGGHAHHRT